MKHTCDRTVPCHFQVQTRLWLWRRWFELVFELLASHAPWIWAWIWPMPRVNISKKCKKPWFSQENHLQMVRFPDLSFQEGTLLWRQEETAYERDDNSSLCNGNLHQFARPLHVWAPPHSTTGLLQHVKRLSTASAKNTARTWKNTIFLLDLPPKVSTPFRNYLLAGLAKTFPEVLSFSSMLPRLPRRTWNYVKLFVTFLGTVSHLKWLGGLFSLVMCVLALKIFHPATLMVGMLTFDGWILLLLYHYIPLDPGWNSLFLCDFVHETFLWSRYLECSPISAVQHTEWRHTVVFQLTLILLYPQCPCCFSRN